MKGQHTRRMKKAWKEGIPARCDKIADQLIEQGVNLRDSNPEDKEIMEKVVTAILRESGGALAMDDLTTRVCHVWTSACLTLMARDGEIEEQVVNGTRLYQRKKTND